MSWSRLLSAPAAYLWSGWGAISSILLLVALWQLGAQTYDSFILPSPTETLVRVQQMLDRPEVIQTLLISTSRALLGATLAIIVGTLLGLLAGMVMTAGMMMRPLVSLLLGMPPIVWLVLAMIWFGMGSVTSVFTVFIVSLPVVFIPAMQGARNLDNQLKELADVYRLSRWRRLTRITLPHLLAWVFPGWILAIGASWKVVIMAELLASYNGIGSELATARAQMDMVGTLAWVVIILAVLMSFEYLLLEPLRRYFERWRRAGG